ncbi:MAG: flavin reductase family protein [Gammaproteobacteria bacterium]|nr:flavin reductase family protein [Gammaproteobacteria bacterium]MDH3859837.1 flavin reductase family protein [Gammaproteobacteria bacterium]
MTNNQEAEIDARDLRCAFGHFATGVTVVTTLDTTGAPCGFTANSFTSVSIDPPLLLVNIARSAYGCDAFTGSHGFAVNILAANQRDLSNRFARAGTDKFANQDWHAEITGSPIIEGVVAWFDCEHFEQVEAGDHIILIGRVLQYAYNTHAPLGFCRGAYVSFGMTPGMLQLVSSPGSLRVGAIIESNGKILLERNHETGQLHLPASESVGDVATPGSLLAKLASAGIEVDLPFIYAAYHEDSQRFVYYLGELLSIDDAVETSTMCFYEFDNITWEEISDSAIIAMLERFIREKRLGNYSIYIGDRAQGEVHPA